jgi:hypothetical protein
MANAAIIAARQLCNRTPQKEVRGIAQQQKAFAPNGIGAALSYTTMFNSAQ